MLDATTGLHGSGGWANYLEVGAEDTAMINATWYWILTEILGNLAIFIGQIWLHLGHIQ